MKPTASPRATTRALVSSSPRALACLWALLVALLAVPATAQHLHVYDSTPLQQPQQYPPLSTCTNKNLTVAWGPSGPIGTPPYTITWSGAATGSTSGVNSLPRLFLNVATPNSGQPLTATLSDASGVLASADYGPAGGPAVGWQTPYLAGHVSGDVTNPVGGTAQLQVDLFSPYAPFYGWQITWSDGVVEYVGGLTQNPVHYRQVSPTVTTVYTAEVAITSAIGPMCGGVYTTGSATVTIFDLAQKSTFGAGCYSITDAAYEYWDVYGSTDVCATGTSITFLRAGTNDGYQMNDLIGTYRVPPPNAAVISTQDDAYGTVPLSTPMPTPNGTTSALTVCTNGYVQLSANTPPIPGPQSYWPGAELFQTVTEPTIFAGPWYDWDPSAGGRLVYEEYNNVLYVTWESILPTGSVGAASTFQYQFHLPTGSCTIVYHDMHLTGVQSWHVLLFGYTPGNAVNPSAFDISAELPAGLDILDTGSAPLTIDSNLPHLGANWDVTTSNIDPLSPIAITFFSTGALSFPVDLILLGVDAPDCFLYINTAFLGSLTAINTGGSGDVTVPIPNDPTLTGATLAAQSICLTLANNANILSSNAVLGTIGN